MYELLNGRGNSYYIDCPARIGLVRTGDSEVCLVDSGSDKDAGHKVRRILDANGWKLKAIFNTHSNADHIGGNSYLQRQTGCSIFVPGIECSFTRHPVLEPSFLFGGYPPGDLRHKFLMAQESDAMVLAEAHMPEGMSVIPLPGHFFDMVGFRTADDVVYLADCLSSQETLEKYGITFIYDVESYLKTLEMVHSMEASLFIPAHAPVTEDIAGLAEYNINKVHEVAERMLAVCKEAVSTDIVIQKMFQLYGLRMDAQQYVLVGSTIRSYLSWLRDKGQIDIVIDDSMLLWKSV